MGLFNQIPGYEGYYEIDRTGNVRSIKESLKQKIVLELLTQKVLGPDVITLAI